MHQEQCRNGLAQARVSSKSRRRCSNFIMYVTCVMLLTAARSLGAPQDTASKCWIDERQVIELPPSMKAVAQLVRHIQETKDDCIVHLWLYRQARPELEIVFGAFPLKSTAGLVGFWSTYFDQLRSANLRVMEVISAPTGAAVRVRDGPLMKHSVLYGEDPFRLSVEGTDYSISFVAKAFLGQTLFVTTEADLTLDRAESVFEALRLRFGRDIAVVLRNDNWFLDWEEFPIYNPFIRQPNRPPSTDEYSKTISIVCHAVIDGAGRSGCYLKRGLQ